MNAPEFNIERIVELLDDLERRLAARGVALDSQIVGDAALLLHGLLDRSTPDIAVRYASAPAVEDAEMPGLGNCCSPPCESRRIIRKRALAAAPMARSPWPER